MPYVTPSKKNTQVQVCRSPEIQKERYAYYHFAHEKTEQLNTESFLEAERKIVYSPELAIQCSNFSLNAKW